MILHRRLLFLRYVEKVCVVHVTVVHVAVVHMYVGQYVCGQYVRVWSNTILSKVTILRCVEQVALVYTLPSEMR